MKKLTTCFRMGLYGGLFGLCFPIVAILIRVSQVGGTETYQILLTDPLLWIIMSAPIILGIFGFQIGRTQEKLQTQYLSLQNLMSEKDSLLFHAGKLATLGEITASIAHELKNPIAIIQMKMFAIQSELTKVQDEQIKKKILDSLNSIDQTTERMIHIIRGISNFARTTDEEVDFVSLFSVLQDSKELTASKVKTSRVEFITPTIPDNHHVRADGVQLTQVFINLINNACDAVIDLPQKKVEVTYEKAGDMGIFRIIDSGNGIPKEVQDRLAKGRYTTKEKGKGTGFGLSISRKIVERYGGQIFIDNSYPQTCFVVKLPLSSYT